VNCPGNLPLGNWVQLYAVCLDFAPDLIIEVGRGYGNSTCVFTEAANRLSDTKVVSIGNDSDRAWNTGTVPRLRRLVSTNWFEPLEVREEDAFKIDFSKICSFGTAILFFWDAHGSQLATHILANLMPQLKNKRNVTLVHDISDARYDDNLTRSYFRADGLPQFWLGDLVGPFEELIPLYDFLSRNRIIYDTPRRSLSRKFATNLAKRDELANCWGLNFLDDSPLELGGLLYFDLNNRHNEGQAQEMVFPEFIQFHDKIQQSIPRGSENKAEPNTMRNIAKVLFGKALSTVMNFGGSKNP
jgi:hypothetical protein